ncbi:hypothetical protein MMARV_C013P2 [viral metagenome]|uniref:Uncharacterized protein n=1 Tax=viral metagenome TaxID=1070528 RepID=A0A6L2ZKT5_9ZZZZ
MSTDVGPGTVHPANKGILRRVERSVFLRMAEPQELDWVRPIVRLPTVPAVGWPDDLNVGVGPSPARQPAAHVEVEDDREENPLVQPKPSLGCTLPCFRFRALGFGPDRCTLYKPKGVPVSAKMPVIKEGKFRLAPTVAPTGSQGWGRGWKEDCEWLARPSCAGTSPCDRCSPLPLTLRGSGCATRVVRSARWAGIDLREGYRFPPHATNALSRGDFGGSPATKVNYSVDGTQSAIESLQQALGGKTVPGFKSGPEVAGATRLRRRAVWVNQVSGLLGLSSGSLGAYLRGRWTPDLPMSAAPLARELAALLEGGAKYLGAGTAEVRPLTRVEVKEDVEVVATPFLGLSVGGDVVRILPELVFYLSARASFRERDTTLVSSLKFKALEWCKSRFLTDATVAFCLPWSVALACSVSRPESGATRALESCGLPTKGECKPRSLGGLGGWLGGEASSFVSGLPSGKWWKKSGTA